MKSTLRLIPSTQVSPDKVFTVQIGGFHEKSFNQVGRFSKQSFSDVVKKKTNSSITLDNFTFDHEKGWVQQPNDPHPKLHIKLEVDPEDWKARGLLCPKVGSLNISVVADSGAMGDLISWSLAMKMGMRLNDIVKVSTRFNGINGSPVEIIGAVFVKISALDRNGKRAYTRAMMYVSESTEKVWLSERSLRNLGVIRKDFPSALSSPFQEIGGLCGRLSTKKQAATITN